MKDQYAFRISADILRYLERADWCFPSPNLGIAFIREDAEIIAFREVGRFTIGKLLDGFSTQEEDATSGIRWYRCSII